MKTPLLIVDGYNMIGAWPELVLLKNQDRLEDAREALLHRLSNYSKYEGLKIIVVFDAQLVTGVTQSYSKYQYKSSLLKKVKLLTAISNASLEN